MSPKSVICCLAATAFVATTALMPTGASLVVMAAGPIGRNRGPGTGRPMLKAGICLCITIIVIITAGGATAINTAGKLRPSQASVSSANQPWRKVAFD